MDDIVREEKIELLRHETEKAISENAQTKLTTKAKLAIEALSTFVNENECTPLLKRSLKGFVQIYLVAKDYAPFIGVKIKKKKSYCHERKVKHPTYAKK